MDQANTFVADDEVEYYEYDWGDYIVGSKEQLQALGIGFGCTYPGESGAPKRALRTQDLRGFEVTVRRISDRRYAARLSFPGWPEPPRVERVTEEVFPGVNKVEYIWHDGFTGQGEALVAAGLVHAAQLPGQPGMGKTSVRFLPDGTVFSGPPTANLRNCTKRIQRVSRATYEVQIDVTQEEADRRWARNEIAEHEWRQKVRAIPRPRRLQLGGAKAPARGHLRLVWSAP